MVTIEKLLDLLSAHGGKIVSTGSLSAEDIKQAEASDRMYVDGNSLGFVWEPAILRFPQTEEEVEFMEKWYPLDIELLEGFDNEVWGRIAKSMESNVQMEHYRGIMIVGAGNHSQEAIARHLAHHVLTGVPLMVEHPVFPMGKLEELRQSPEVFEIKKMQFEADPEIYVDRKGHKRNYRFHR